MAAQAFADRAMSTGSGWSVPSNEMDAAHTRGREAGAADAVELSRWLAQVLVEERQALRSAMERSHRETWAALDEELGRRHGVLAARLRERYQAQHAPQGDPQCLPGVPSKGEHDGLASQVTIDATPRPTDQAPPLAAPGAVLQQFAARRRSRGGAAGDDTSSGDGHGPGAAPRSVESEPTSPKVLKRFRTHVFQEKEEQRRQKWAEFVEGVRFETCMAVLIVLNGLQMAFQVQHQGLVRGHGLRYRDYVNNPDPWPGAENILDALSMFFGIVFTCEQFLKVSVLRDKFFKSGWNVFDLFVVLCFLVEVSAVAGGRMTDTTIFRLARLARLLRLVRVLRQMHCFDTLFLMTTALHSSMYVLAWSCILLFIIQALVAFSINQILVEFYFKDDHPPQEAAEVFEYFGSFSRALLSTFEMALANWPPVCRLLMENVSEWFMVVCLFHKLTVGFAVVGIINGVFISETFKTAEQDDFIMMHRKERATRTHRIKMERFFASGDANGDGFLSKEEWLQLTHTAEVKMWLLSMGLEVRDGNALFDLIDANGDGFLSASEVIEEVSRLKGGARSLDVLTSLKRQEQLYRDLQDIIPEIEQRRNGQVFTSDSASLDVVANCDVVSFASPRVVSAW